MEACLPGICGSFLLLVGIFEGDIGEWRYHATLIVTNTPFAKSYTGGLDLFFFGSRFFFIVVFLFIYLFIYYLAIYLLFIYLFLGGGVGRQKSLRIFLNYI